MPFLIFFCAKELHLNRIVSDLRIFNQKLQHASFPNHALNFSANLFLNSLLVTHLITNIYII